MQAAQGIPLSPTVQIVNQGFDFSPASFEELSPESQSILDSLMPPPPAPRTSSPAGVGVPVRNVSQSPVPTVRGPVQAIPTQGAKQPRRRPPPPSPDGGDGDGDDSGPSNGGDTPRSRRSGVPSDRGDLQDAFEQMSDREGARLRKKNVQSVTHTSTITTVYKDGRPPSVRRTSMRESPAPNQNSVCWHRRVCDAAAVYLSKDVNLYHNLVVYFGIVGLTERPNVELKDCSDSQIMHEEKHKRVVG